MSSQLAVYKPSPVHEIPMVEMGNIMAESGFFQDTRQAAQAIVKIQAGRELGFGPVQSMMGIHIIKNKVSLSSNLMAAAIKRSGKYTYRHKVFTNDACVLEFFEDGQPIGESSFTMKDAQTAGLGGENYKKFPRNMLFSRALSNGAKWYCPDVFGGPVYTPDELGADVDGETGEVRRVTPAPVLTDAGGTDTGATFETITEEQAREIEGRLADSGADVEKFKKWAGVERILDIPASRYEDVLVTIAEKAAKAAKNGGAK